jgi:hypothetical protein
MAISESPGTSVLKVKISNIFSFNNRSTTDTAIQVTDGRKTKLDKKL